MIPQLMEFLHTIARGVVNPVEHLKAPWQALRARATDAFLAESIEAEVPQFKTTLVFALAECIKFGVHFIKEISIPLCHRMSLHLIGSYRQNLATMKDDAAMALGTIDAKTQFLCQLIDIARAFDSAHSCTRRPIRVFDMICLQGFFRIPASDEPPAVVLLCLVPENPSTMTGTVFDGIAIATL